MFKICFMLLSPIFSLAQEHKCDSGWSYMPTIGTTSLVIQADTCLPDSTCDKLWKEFYKNGCGETSFAYGELGLDGNCDSCLSYSSQNTWNDSTGCSTKETWYKTIKGESVEISKEEFEIIQKIKEEREKIFAKKKKRT